MGPMIFAVAGVALFTSFVLICLSFDSLEYQEMGLNFSWITETVEERTYHAGRYYLGLGNHFLIFPKTVQSIFFVGYGSGETQRIQGPPLQSRTHDGLNIEIEVSFQYKLKPDYLYQLFNHLGHDYEPTFVRMAIEELSTCTTRYNASNFFTNRTVISEEMEQSLNNHFSTHAYATVPFFQLRTVHLPPDFEEAIQLTQVKRQDIEIAKWEQASMNVTFQTKVMKAEYKIQVLQTQAMGKAEAIRAENHAYCLQYNTTQGLQAAALASVRDGTGWSPSQLLEYIKIRAVRAHPSEMMTVRL